MKLAKRAEIVADFLIQVIIFGLVFSLFLIAINTNSSDRGVKQQILEKQTALLIDAAGEGMRFEIAKESLNGIVGSVELREGSVFIMVDGLASLDGYPYFSRYDVRVKEEKSKFVVEVR